MNITKKFGKKAIAFVLAVAMLVGILATYNAAIAFTDVPANQWYYADVTELASKGVVSGVGNNKFEPNRTVANAEMIKMVVNAFFRSDFNAYEQANSNTMYAYFGTQLYWFSFMSYYARQTGLLDGIDVDIRDYASCYQPMTRNDMAMILANAAEAKGIAPTEAQKAAVQSDIKDYASIPAKYQDAVKTCFALKTTNASGDVKSLLEGDNGWFYGRDGTSVNMTRAEACAVIVRLDNLIVSGGTVVDPDPGTSTEPTVKDVQTSSEYWSGNSNTGATSGNAWTVTDNGFGDGRLNNGKPITEDNVIELLAEAEKVWPTGTKWAPSGSNNNFYKSSGSVSALMMKTQTTGASVNASSNFACSGFAAMISDYLFGRDNNMFHRVTDKVNGIRPGDIVLMIDTTTNRVNHAFVATSTSYTEYEGNGTAHPGFVYGADGNSSGKVNWPGEYDSGTSEASSGYTWQVYSRYPA